MAEFEPWFVALMEKMNMKLWECEEIGLKVWQRGYRAGSMELWIDKK